MFFPLGTPLRFLELNNKSMKNIIMGLMVLCTSYHYAQEPTKAETVSVHNKNIYYEVYGKGKPLIFLHGYSLSSKSWKPYVSDFYNDYEVYLIDLTGHGKSDTFSEDLSISEVAKDVNALLQHLNLKQIQAIGFSFGGDVLYQLALQQPKLIKSMITIGAVGTWSVHDFPKYQKAFTFDNKANFPWLSDHRNDAQIKAIMTQFKNYTVKISTKELQSIVPEVLIMIGDDDEGMDLSEVARVKKNLPKSDLWVLPNVAHGAHEGKTKAEFVEKAKAFLTKS